MLKMTRVLSLSALLFTTVSGCTSLLQSLVPMPPSEAREQWTSILASKAAIEAAPVPTTVEEFKRQDTSTGEAVGLVANFIDRFCIGTVSSIQERATPERCAEAESLRAQQAQKYQAVIEKGLTLLGPSLDWTYFQDKVMQMERVGYYAGLPIDRWMSILEKNKHDYWVSELSRRGDMASYVERKGESLCLTFTQAPAEPPALEYLGSLFKADETVYLKCRFMQAPSGFQRDASDYWRVDVFWGSSFSPTGLTYEVQTPSTSQWVSFKFPADMIAEKLQEQAQQHGFKYPGTWLRIRVHYVTRRKTGVTWVNDVLQDVWDHQEVNSASFFYKRP